MAGKVTKIIEKTNSSPLILSFQNGQLSEQRNGEKRKVSVEGEKMGLRRVKVKLGNHEFEGDEEQSRMGRRTFIGVRKAATGEVKLVEVSRTFPLLNKIHSVEKERKDVGGDFQTRNSALQKLFGGKKGIRRIEKSEKFRVNAATNETSLLSSVKEIEVKEVEESVSKQIADSLADFLPPCNREAKHVDYVYNLAELIGQDVIDALPDFSLDSLPAMEKLLAFTQSVVKALPSNPSREAVIGVALIEAIFRFISINAQQLRKVGTCFSEHEVIHNKIVENYTTKNDRGAMSRSMHNRDKAAALAIAIAVAATKQVAMNFLAQDSNFGKAKVMKFVRAIGCVPKERGGTIYVLKLPLPPLKFAAPRKM